MKKPETAPPATPVRGKYTNLLKQGSNLVILDPELLPHFPDSESVNRALHAFLAARSLLSAEQVRSAATRARSRRRPAASHEFDPRVGAESSSAR
jgi:hypothetical protein